MTRDKNLLYLAALAAALFLISFVFTLDYKATFFDVTTNNATSTTSNTSTFVSENEGSVLGKETTALHNVAYVSVCTVIVDGQGNLVIDQIPPGTAFGVKLYTYTRTDPPPTPINLSGVWKNITFSPPYTANADVVAGDGANDAFCGPALTVEFPEGYEEYYVHYTPQRLISSGGLNWADPKYTDTYRGNPGSLNDFLNYSNELWDNIPGNEGLRDWNADGEVHLRPNQFRYIVILNRTDFVVPTATPTVLPTATVIPTEIVPTATNLPDVTSETTAVPAPTVVSEPTLLPTPSEVILNEPIITIRPETRSLPESATFEFLTDLEDLSCSSDLVNLATKITANYPIAAIEFSLDAGSNWYPVELLGSDKSLEVLLNFLRPQQKAVLQIRALLESGGIAYSDKVDLSFKCEGEIVILGNYFKNGYTHAILSDSGDVIYNSDLKLQLFAETLGPVSELNLRLADSPQKLVSEDAFIEVPLEYDFTSGTWSVDIPSKHLQQKITHTALVSGTYSKTLPSILNINLWEPNLSAEQFSSIEYTVYTFDSRRKELTYVNDFENSFATSSYPKLNLSPGIYQIKLTLNGKVTAYTYKFKLDKNSVVILQPSSKHLQFLKSIFEPVPVKIVPQGEVFALDHDIVTTDEQALHYYQKFSADLGLDPLQKHIFVYWNRWNPHFTEALPAYKRLVELSQTHNLGKVILVTDSNNIEELRRIVKLSYPQFSVYLNTDSDYFHTQLRYQPELVIYIPESQKILRINSNNPGLELVNIIINNLNS